MNRVKVCLTVLIPVLIVLFSGCSKKKDSAPPATATTTTSSSPYYFRFTLNNKTDTINGDNSKSYTQNTNAILGIISSNKYTLTPAITLRFSLPVNADTVKESDVLGLAGKTLYFSDTFMRPEIDYQETSSSDTWYSQVVADPSYNVKVASIVFSDTANYQGNPVRTYVITGTCRAKVHQYVDKDTSLTGSFKMVLSRVTY